MSWTSFWRLETQIASQLSTLDEIKKIIATTLPWPGVWGKLQRYLTVTWCLRQVSEVHSSEPASEGHSLVLCTPSRRLSWTALWSGPVSSLSRVELKTPIILLILPGVIYVGWAVPEQESFFFFQLQPVPDSRRTESWFVQNIADVWWLSGKPNLLQVFSCSSASF